MKILYLSCHSVLEYDEVSLLTELGHDVFSIGAYTYPEGHPTLPRPGIPTLKKHEDLIPFTVSINKTNLPDELIEWADCIMIMHTPEILLQNWPKIKHKRVIWRSIGQSTASIEDKIRPLFDQGLQIVRYSPKERNISGYVGASAMIRFYKDPDEYKGWIGNKERVINFTQTLLGRRYFCHYDEIMQATDGFDRVVYGTGNEDLGSVNGGELSYEDFKKELRENRVYFYGGTWPASYTLSFMEAWMTGIPVVALGRALAQTPRFEQFEFYEVHELIENGISGFVSDDIGELKSYIKQLMDKPELAKKIGKRGRTQAIAVFGKEKIAKEWEEFLKKS